MAQKRLSGRGWNFWVAPGRDSATGVPDRLTGHTGLTGQTGAPATAILQGFPLLFVYQRTGTTAAEPGAAAIGETMADSHRLSQIKGENQESNS
jgi:hypothetical protein